MNCLVGVGVPALAWYFGGFRISDCVSFFTEVPVQNTMKIVKQVDSNRPGMDLEEKSKNNKN